MPDTTATPALDPDGSNLPTDFTFYSDPYDVIPGVTIGLGTVADDSDRIYISFDTPVRLLTSAQARAFAIAVLQEAQVGERA